MDHDQLRRDLQDNNQEHLFQYWDTLPEDQKLVFYRDLRNIDYPKINRAFDKTMNEAKSIEKKEG